MAAAAPVIFATVTTFLFDPFYNLQILFRVVCGGNCLCVKSKGDQSCKMAASRLLSFWRIC